MDPRFTGEIIAAAQQSQAKWGVPASVSMAQWALESNYGKSMPPGSNNPFGIKALAGQPSVGARTWEEVNGKAVYITAGFRKFASLADAFDAHGKLLATSHYYVKAMSLRGDAAAFANALTGVYATDSAYGSKLNKIMSSNGLLAFNDTSAKPLTTAVTAGREQVRALQSALQGLGYSPGAVDGYIGPNTLQGVEAFLFAYSPKKPVAAPSSAAQDLSKAAEKEPQVAAEINILQGFINTFKNLGSSIGAVASVVESPNIPNSSLPAGGKIGATVSDAKKAAAEVAEIVKDFEGKDLVGGIDDAIDLAKLVFGALDRWGVHVPVVSQIVQALPDLDPAG